jgi:hypothetical protein
VNKAQPHIEKTEDADPIFPTVSTTFIISNADSPAVRRATAAAAREVSAIPEGPLNGYMAEAERVCAAYLKSLGVPIDWRGLLATKPSDQRAQDARQALICLKQLRDALVNGDAPNAAYHAVRLTRACTQFDIRPLGPAVSTGARQRANLKKISGNRYGKTKVNKEACSEWLGNYLTEHPRHSQTRAVTETAAHFDIDAKTVRTYIKK